MTALTLSSLYDTVRTLERVLGAFPVLILATDRDGRIVMSTERTRDTLGRAEVEMMDMTVGDVVPGLTLKIGPVPPTGSDSPPPVEIGAPRRRAVRRDGSAFPVEVQASVHPLGDDMICVVALLDMTERLHADRAFRESQALLDAVLSGLPAMVSAKTPEGTYEFVNAYQADVFGIEPADAVGKSAADLIGSESGRPIDGADHRIVSGKANAHSGPEKLIDGEGRARTFMTTRAAMRDAKGHLQRVLTVALDITHATAAEERLDRLALLDELTGLPNRSALQQILYAQTQRAKRDTKRIGLVLLTVSNLAEVVDEFGDVGRDTLLRRLGIRLGGLVEESNVLARYDDSTFALVLANPNDDAALEHEAARLIARAARPVTVSDEPVTVKCRAGIAIYPESGVGAEELLRAAEHGLRSDAARAIAPARQNAAEIEAFMTTRQQASRDLRRDLEHNALATRFRPVHRLADRALIGFEACLYDSAGRLLVPIGQKQDPAALAAAASIENLAPELFEHLLRDACAATAHVPEMQRISLPMPGDVLHRHDLEEIVTEVLQRTRLAPSRLQLSVEERILAGDPEAAGDVLNRLRDLGVALALTGFGAGGNPMLALPRQPFTLVVLSVDESVAPDATVGAMIGFAQALDRSVGAQGVQTALQSEALHRAGCTEVSGPIFGDPLELDAATALARRVAAPAVQSA